MLPFLLLFSPSSLGLLRTKIMSTWRRRRWRLTAPTTSTNINKKGGTSVSVRKCNNSWEEAWKAAKVIAGWSDEEKENPEDSADQCTVLQFHGVVCCDRCKLLHFGLEPARPCGTPLHDVRCEVQVCSHMRVR